MLSGGRFHINSLLLSSFKLASIKRNIEIIEFRLITKFVYQKGRCTDLDVYLEQFDMRFIKTLEFVVFFSNLHVSSDTNASVLMLDL